MHNYKEFKDFNDGVIEMRQTVQDINNIISKYEQECPGIEKFTPELLTTAIIDSVMNDFPCIDDKEYPRTVALSISAKEVGYKSRGAMSFGWKNIIKEETGELCYSFRISFFSRAPYVLKIEKILAELGWTQKTIEFKQLVSRKGEFTKRNKSFKRKHEDTEVTKSEPVDTEVVSESAEPVKEDAPGKLADSIF
jgi:hypothetical protein